VPNEMWLQRRGATRNEKLNSPPDHHRSLPTLVMLDSIFIFVRQRFTLRSFERSPFSPAQK
jgi:hypothetical protein